MKHRKKYGLFLEHLQEYLIRFLERLYPLLKHVTNGVFVTSGGGIGNNNNGKNENTNTNNNNDINDGSKEGEYGGGVYECAIKPSMIDFDKEWRMNGGVTGWELRDVERSMASSTITAAIVYMWNINNMVKDDTVSSFSNQFYLVLEIQL